MFWENTVQPELANSRQRARFEAVRRRVFEEMQDVTARKRTALILPFQVIVIAILASRGTSSARLAIQVVSFAVAFVAMTIAERTNTTRNITLAFIVAGGCTLVGVGNTGGLASPLLVSVLPFVVGLSMNPNLDRTRFAVLGFFLVGFLLMGALANTSLGELCGPLAPQWHAGNRMHFASLEYVTLSLVSATMSAIAVFKIGRSVGMAYEHIALELAVRREEICDESEGRTRALEGIAARLAHEVKNPLAAIKGLSAHMARSATDEKVRERLTIVAAEADRLQAIVEGFLSFSRGLEDLSIGPTKPYELAHELSLLLETRAADAGVTLEVRGARELQLSADDKKLRQALLNLVLNAMQASARGTTVTVDVTKNCAAGSVAIRVIDRGSGMSPEVLDRIAKPYFTTKEGGSGLGIAVARGIIEQHGGSLMFESTKGCGTTATLTLPACAKAEQDKVTKLPMCRSFFDALVPSKTVSVPHLSHDHDHGHGDTVSVAASSLSEKISL